MKATLRKNGLMMLTIKMEFNVAYEQAVEALVEHFLQEEPAPTNRTGVLEIFKKALRNNGFWMTYDARSDEDCYSKEQYNTAHAKAIATVNKFFPDLKGGAVTEVQA